MITTHISSTPAHVVHWREVPVDWPLMLGVSVYVGDGDGNGVHPTQSSAAWMTGGSGIQHDWSKEFGHQHRRPGDIAPLVNCRLPDDAGTAGLRSGAFRVYPAACDLPLYVRILLLRHFDELSPPWRRVAEAFDATLTANTPAIIDVHIEYAA